MKSKCEPNQRKKNPMKYVKIRHHIHKLIDTFAQTHLNIMKKFYDSFYIRIIWNRCLECAQTALQEAYSLHL